MESEMGNENEARQKVAWQHTLFISFSLHLCSQYARILFYVFLTRETTIPLHANAHVNLYCGFISLMLLPDELPVATRKKESATEG